MASSSFFGSGTIYATHLRFREIGIRKVLGASVPGIIALLAKDFIRLVLLGVVIAVPVAGYAMKQRLAGFAYRTDFHWTIFLVAAVVTIGIALLTISLQSVKAAMANPVASLKTERDFSKSEAQIKLEFLDFDPRQALLLKEKIKKM